MCSTQKTLNPSAPWPGRDKDVTFPEQYYHLLQLIYKGDYFLNDKKMRGKKESPKKSRDLSTSVEKCSTKSQISNNTMCFETLVIKMYVSSHVKLLYIL